MTHAELRELLPLLALDLLAASERAALAAHLDGGCAECAGDLRAHRATAATLAYDAPPVTAPAALRERVLRACTAPVTRDAAVARVWRDWTALPAQDGLSIVRAGEGCWEPVRDGVTVKRLSLDAERRTATMLVRMLAASEYPRHRHARAEECLVLEGDLHIGDDILMQAGDFQRAEAGSAHRRQWTTGGCLLLVSSSLDDELQD
jgi:anti-sigma factor ChrR (cupin superfamily)